MPLSLGEILKFLEKRTRKPLSAKDILADRKLSKAEYRDVVRMLEALADDGTLVRYKGGRYALSRETSLVEGTVSIHRDGYGFVCPAAEGKKDLYIPARFLGHVMDGDRVLAKVERISRVGKPEGRIVEVLERAHQTVLGQYEEGRTFSYVVPADSRHAREIVIAPDSTMGASQGNIVVVRIDAYPDENRRPEGAVIEVLGEPDDPEVEIRSIAYKYGLPHKFPAEVLKKVKDLPEGVCEEDRQGRKDLSHLPIVTIDGETAMDFDDAVAVSREDEGRIRLWVSIADVGHYVEEDSIVDREAYERGTSVYFPGRCIPMLPEVLSNGICSLNPNVERLAMTAEMVFDREGRRIESSFYPSVIKSRARLTYREVKDMLVDEDQVVVARYPEIYPHLAVMEDLAMRLMEMRRRRGSLDFDLPEAEIVLDLRGEPEKIVCAERTVAHQIIEEFMLAANEAVAVFLTERGANLLFRVHEGPDLDKLQAFQEFLSHFNYGFSIDTAGVSPATLQSVLAQVQGKPEERMINQVLLKSMKQAHYSSENVGHFGLATDLYCHFTSPIRRYPDLVVHRILRRVLKKGALSEKQVNYLKRILPATAEHTSQRERRAMEAEREIVDLKKCQFMADKVGEEFVGIVSSVTPFGFFVELEEVFVQGLVHISTLEDDYYHYEENLHRLIGERRRRIFQVGSRVRVAVKNVSLQRREIDFVLTDIQDVSNKRDARFPSGG